MGRRKTQLALFQPSPMQFGGSLLKGNPKFKRPLSTKNPIHLVLKSEKAFGAKSMLNSNHVAPLARIVQRQARLCGVKIYHFVNVGNHLHFVLRIRDRKLYLRFVRSVSGLIPRLILKRERGSPSEKHKPRSKSEALTNHNGFWIARPFTRIATWGRDYRTLTKYMDKNRLQAQSLGSKVIEKLGAIVVGFDFQTPTLKSG